MRIINRVQNQFPEPLSDTIKRFLIAVVFSITFGYIEASVVVYLREIFYPQGFTFPIVFFEVEPLWRRLLLTEIGREASTIVLILIGAWLFGKNRRQRFAYFLIIFAVWDIFYYVWLKVLLGWPATVMEWDILFLIPVAWAAPILYPVIVSILMLAFAMVILYEDSLGRSIKVRLSDWVVFFLAALIIIISFCIPGPHLHEAEFASYFYWPIFAAGMLLAIATFAKCYLKSERAV
jgi:hypothetical protein